MKNILVIFTLLLATAGCNKNHKLPDAKASTLVNGENWEVKKVWAFNSDVGVNTLDFSLSFDKFGYSSGLLFNNVSRSPGKQTLRKKIPGSIHLIYSALFNAQESDVTGDEYDVLDIDSTNNWIEITKEKDNFSKNIYGQFSVTLIRKKKFENSPFPDTLRFTNGTFYISELKD